MRIWKWLIAYLNIRVIIGRRIKFLKRRVKLNFISINEVLYNISKFEEFISRVIDLDEHLEKE